MYAVAVPCAERERERAAEALGGGGGEMVHVGKLQYDASEAGMLGRGCEGTIVYRGVFDGRPAAVKRIPNVCAGVGGVRRATMRELQLLRSMNVQHCNLLRYYCMEEDADYTYLGLELCLCTLQQLVEQRSLGLHLDADGAERPPDVCTPLALQIQAAARFFTDTQLFAQLLEGLAYLHSLSIGTSAPDAHGMACAPHTSYCFLRTVRVHVYVYRFRAQLIATSSRRT